MYADGTFLRQFSLLAQQPRGESSSTLWDLAFAVGGLLLAIFVLAWVLIQRKRNPDIATHELLTDFRQMQDSGDLSPEEFKKIKGILSQRLRAEIDSPPKVQPPPSEE